MTAKPTIPTFPTVPSRTQSGPVFSANADAWVAFQPELAGYMDDVADYVDARADDALAAAVGGDLPPLTGQGGKLLAVKDDETGAEFVDDPIGALGSNGFVARTGAGTAAARTLTAGTGITITNGDGVAGNPVISGGVPSGAVSHFAMNAAPSGWLKANGAAVSRTTYAALFAALVTSAGFTSQTFTVSIASPAVFTKTAHGFTGGERLRLSTTGALPTGLDNTTDYFVIFVDANTFHVSTTFNGTAVNTSGTQSGTHSYIQSLWGLGNGSTTFNIPDLRGEFMRGWDDGRGIDTGRAFGSAQGDAIRNISGEFHNWAQNGQGVYATGPFAAGIARGSGGQVSGAGSFALNFDASRSVPTANENRPRNIALLACIKF